jgi:hypothetical protein
MSLQITVSLIASSVIINAITGAACSITPAVEFQVSKSFDKIRLYCAVPSVLRQFVKAAGFTPIQRIGYREAASSTYRGHIIMIIECTPEALALCSKQCALPTAADPAFETRAAASRGRTEAITLTKSGKPAAASTIAKRLVKVAK